MTTLPAPAPLVFTDAPRLPASAALLHERVPSFHHSGVAPRAIQRKLKGSHRHDLRWSRSRIGRATSAILATSVGLKVRSLSHALPRLGERHREAITSRPLLLHAYSAPVRVEPLKIGVSLGRPEMEHGGDRGDGDD